MAQLHEGVRVALGRTKLTVMPEDYFVVHLPADAKLIPGEWYRPATTRFAVFIREPKEITLVVGRRKWLRMKNLFKKYEVSSPMKVIGFDALPASITPAYMAAITAVLAESKLSSVPMSPFGRNHLLVPKSDLPRTIRLINTFLESCRPAKSGK